MDAKSFFKNFKALLKTEELKAYYHDNTAWTDKIKDIIENMIGKDNVNREYYRIDTLKFAYTDYYKSFAKEHKQYFSGSSSKSYYLNVYNWKNKIAIEYENDCHSWTDELVKLSHLRSDLKVIVAYSEWDGSFDNYKALIKEKVGFAVELIKACQEQALQDNWLLIFGPCKGGKVYDDCLADYFIGYEMDNMQFKLIE